MIIFKIYGHEFNNIYDATNFWFKNVSPYDYEQWISETYSSVSLMRIIHNTQWSVQKFEQWLKENFESQVRSKIDNLYAKGEYEKLYNIYNIDIIEKEEN